MHLGLYLFKAFRVQCVQQYTESPVYFSDAVCCVLYGKPFTTRNCKPKRTVRARLFEEKWIGLLISVFVVGADLDPKT